MPVFDRITRWVETNRKDVKPDYHCSDHAKADHVIAMPARSIRSDTSGVPGTYSLMQWNGAQQPVRATTSLIRKTIDNVIEPHELPSKRLLM